MYGSSIFRVRGGSKREENGNHKVDIPKSTQKLSSGGVRHARRGPTTPFVQGGGGGVSEGPVGMTIGVERETHRNPTRLMTPSGSAESCSRKHLLVGQLEVYLVGVPFRGRTRGGESERGRKGTGLDEGPLPCWCHF